MQKVFLLIGSVLGAFSVMIGAFGAHALKSLLEKNGRIETFDTAVKYQFYHVVAIIIVGVLMYFLQNKWLSYSGWCFIIGTFIFSGSLYALCITNVTKFGAITPIGGLLLILGWIFLMLAIIKSSF